MDDFILGEPVPETSTVMSLLTGGTLAAFRRKRRVVNLAGASGGSAPSP